MTNVNIKKNFRGNMPSKEDILTPEEEIRLKRCILSAKVFINFIILKVLRFREKNY